MKKSFMLLCLLGGAAHASGAYSILKYQGEPLVSVTGEAYPGITLTIYIGAANGGTVSCTGNNQVFSAEVLDSNYSEPWLLSSLTPQQTFVFDLYNCKIMQWYVYSYWQEGTYPFGDSKMAFSTITIDGDQLGLLNLDLWSPEPGTIVAGNKTHGQWTFTCAGQPAGAGCVGPQPD